MQQYLLYGLVGVVAFLVLMSSTNLQLASLSPVQDQYVTVLDLCHPFNDAGTPYITDVFGHSVQSKDKPGPFYDSYGREMPAWDLYIDNQPVDVYTKRSGADGYLPNGERSDINPHSADGGLIYDNILFFAGPDTALPYPQCPLSVNLVGSIDVDIPDSIIAETGKPLEVLIPYTSTLKNMPYILNLGYYQKTSAGYVYFKTQDVPVILVSRGLFNIPVPTDAYGQTKVTGRLFAVIPQAKCFDRVCSSELNVSSFSFIADVGSLQTTQVTSVGSQAVVTTQLAQPATITIQEKFSLWQWIVDFVRSLW